MIATADQSDDRMRQGEDEPGASRRRQGLFPERAKDVAWAEFETEGQRRARALHRSCSHVDDMAQELGVELASHRASPDIGDQAIAAESPVPVGGPCDQPPPPVPTASDVRRAREPEVRAGTPLVIETCRWSKARAPWISLGLGRAASKVARSARTTAVG